ncbi:hypothetical protein AeMF1_008290 [Aphanomyces euteiches]|nr:hypothetical protein AeMF1_008290 [Aphanomyces euteiches]
MLTLVCVVVGHRGNPFPVEIEAGKLVGILKQMIKKEKQSITCDADELKLYLALKNGAWLSDEDADLKDLSHIGREAVVCHTGKELIQEDLELDPADTIGACFVGEQEN